MTIKKPDNHRTSTDLPDAAYPHVKKSPEGPLPAKSMNPSHLMSERAGEGDEDIVNLSVVLSDNSATETIPTVQHNFRQALNQLNHTCSGLMLMQMIAHHGGLVGLSGLYYQPGGHRSAIRIDHAGGNLPGNALNQLRRDENVFLQQSKTAFSALYRQLAVAQYQVQENARILASLGQQAGMRPPQLLSLLPVITQPQAIALGTFPGIYTGVGMPATPWLPNGFTASFDAAAAQKPIAFVQYWVAGTPALLSVSTTRGFYFRPDAPREDSVFQSPFSPYGAWQDWCSHAERQPLPVLYPSLECSGISVENDNSSLMQAVQRRPVTRTLEKAGSTGNIDEIDEKDFEKPASKWAAEPATRFREGVTGTKDQRASDKRRLAFAEPDGARKNIQSEELLKKNQWLENLLAKTTDKNKQLNERVEQQKAALKAFEDAMNSSKEKTAKYKEEINHVLADKVQLTEEVNHLNKKLAYDKMNLNALISGEGKEKEVALVGLNRTLDEQLEKIELLSKRNDEINGQLEAIGKRKNVLMDSDVIPIVLSKYGISAVS